MNGLPSCKLKYPAVCPACLRDMPKGTEAVKPEGSRWMHESCLAPVTVTRREPRKGTRQVYVPARTEYRMGVGPLPLSSRTSEA
jgi:hypothetical protein